MFHKLMGFSTFGLIAELRNSEHNWRKQMEEEEAQSHILETIQAKNRGIFKLNSYSFLDKPALLALK